MRRLVPLFLVLGLLAAGCGGGSTATSAGFAAALKRTCDEYSARAESIQEAPGDPTSPDASPALIAQFQRVLQQIATLFGEQLDRLRQLDPPAAEAARYHGFLRLYADAESALTQAARAARRGDQAGMLRQLARLEALGTKIEATGFECG